MEMVKTRMTQRMRAVTVPMKPPCSTPSTTPVSLPVVRT